MHPYVPELPFVLPPDERAIENAIQNQQILQAMCTKADEHGTLYLDLGDRLGIIPHCEGAIGMNSPQFRDISILSRVGRAVSFRITEIQSDGTVLCSRKAAQAEVRSFVFSALNPGDILTVRVQNTSALGSFCDLGCGLTALMPICRCCTSRLSHSRELHRRDELIPAALWQLQESEGRVLLSGRETLGTWKENAEHFRQGQTVAGTVRSVMPYGAFVELLPNLSGLAEPHDGIAAGDPVSVYIRAILPDKHKIKLNILDTIPECPAFTDPDYAITSGHINRWAYYPGSRAVTYF